MAEDTSDQLAIRANIEAWAIWSDAGDWDKFRTCWHDDGYMFATWFQAPCEGFVTARREGWEKGELVGCVFGRNEIVAGTVSPSYMLPLHGLQRLEKIMDEYVGGTSTNYLTNEPMLTRGLELLSMLKEDLDHIGADSLHQLQRAWELQHRVWASESVTRHTMFREETRWPGYYYRADHPKLDDTDWHCFTLSRYNPESGEWAMEKAPVHHIID